MIEARLWRLYVWCCLGMRLCVNGDVVRTRNMHKYEYLMFFPILTSGVFVFSFVSAFRRRLPSPHSHSLTLILTRSLTLTYTHSHTHTHTHTHSLTLTHSHSHTHSLTTHSLTHIHSLTHTHSLTLTHSHSLTHTLTHSHSLTLTYSYTHSLSLLTHSHTHSLICILRGRHGTMWTAKGSDVRPGVPRATRFLRNGVGQCAQPRGRMYALASLGLRLFCVAGMG